MAETLLRLLVLAAAVNLGWHVRSLMLGFASLRWETARGRVLACHVDDLRFGFGRQRGGDGNHAVVIRYAYRVRGSTFASTRLSYRPTRWILFEEAVDYLHGLRRGAEVSVRYDPLHPSRAVLVPGASDENLLRVLLALVVFAGCVWVWLR